MTKASLLYSLGHYMGDPSSLIQSLSNMLSHVHKKLQLISIDEEISNWRMIERIEAAIANSGNCFSNPSLSRDFKEKNCDPDLIVM